MHDNAHPRAEAHTLETLRKLKLEVMEHPAHSPDWVSLIFKCRKFLKIPHIFR
jgi:hypothetical protein